MRAKTILAVVMLLSILAFIALSQSNDNSVSADVKNERCFIEYYEETESTYGYVKRINYLEDSCYESSNDTYYPCISEEEYESYEQTGQRTVLKDKTICSPSSFEITIGNDKKEIDFSSWGVCVQENEGDCVAILCGTLQGGSARNGIFNGCDGGKSCKKFLFCPNDVKVLVKSSGDDFVSENPTYNLPNLDISEVEE